MDEAQVSADDVRVAVALAGNSIDVRCAPAAEPLVGAFVPSLGPAAGAPTLRLAMRVDAPYLTQLAVVDSSSARHYRRGAEHRWITQSPRQLQHLTLDHPPHAHLVVDGASLQDGAIRARPAVDAISAWAASCGIMPLHASAVALGGEALLFIGEGGRGKTTTALSLALRGWQLIADDRCFLELTSKDIVVHGLYPTAILTPSMAERLGASSWGDLGTTHEGKVACRLPAAMPMVSAATLRAVVTPSQGEGAPYRVTPLNRRTALAAWQGAFAPALQANGPSPLWLLSFARATRTVPAWGVSLGWDFGRLDRALRGLLAPSVGDGA